jgi:hypothetical protein
MAKEIITCTGHCLAHIAYSCEHRTYKHGAINILKRKDNINKKAYGPAYA